MENRHGIAPGAAAPASGTSAQDPVSFDGTGSASFSGRCGIERDARRVLGVQRSKVLVGGSGWRARLGVVDARTLAGSFSGNRGPTLTRR